LVLAPAAPARAVVLHPDTGMGEQVPADQRPPDGAVARWSSSATGAVISPNHVITTNHQGGGVGTSVYVNGVRYVVAAWYRDGVSDFKVARIATPGGEPANLTDYARIYGSLNEVGKTAVIGGYGDGRGETRLRNNQPYAYAWDGASNTVLRWGRNVFDGYAYKSGGGWSSQVLKTDFDDVGIGAHVTWEAATADHDSGAPWFLQVSGKWYVAALTRSTEHLGSTWFRSYGDPSRPDPELMDAVRVGWYRNWINYVVYDLLSGDANCDGTVGIADLNVVADYYGKLGGANWMEGDFNGDHSVGIADLVALADRYGDSAGLSGATVPEPAAMVLLIAAGPALLRRRATS
jgi:hypothetical protein